MNKSQDFENHHEIYQLKEADLIALIQGKSFHFMVPGKYHIEVRPPNHGITLTYAEWSKLKNNMINSPDFSYSDAMKFIDDVEGRKR